MAFFYENFQVTVTCTTFQFAKVDCDRAYKSANSGLEWPQLLLLPLTDDAIRPKRLQELQLRHNTNRVRKQGRQIRPNVKKDIIKL